jgi:Cft2 family RNA processing exonuclease
LQVEYRDAGIFLPEAGLWLDSRIPVAMNWISHAHSDHAVAGHGQIFASAQTLEILDLRAEPEALGRSVLHAMADGEEVRLPSGAVLRAIPAAHILGARQLLVEFGGERLVYTGDIKLRTPLLGSTTEVVACDHLILESTFGLPIYRFLRREVAAERIAGFARECLAEGAIPAYFGYPLGRGQEIVHALCQAGIPVAVHGAIARLIPPYEKAGYAFPGWEPYEGLESCEGKALVVTPGFRNILEASSKIIRMAYVSGWAALDNARARSGAEELIPYSDHGDFEELIEIVQTSGARRVDVVHGYTEAFARILRLRYGLDARAAGGVRREEDEDGGNGPARAGV